MPTSARLSGFTELPLLRRDRNRCFADLRPHKLHATLRSAYVRLSQSRGAKLALLEPHAIPRPVASGRSRPFRCSSSPNCKRFAGLQFGSICLARKSGQKEALENDLWRLRADFLSRPVRAQDCYISDSLSFWQVYHTQSRIADSGFWFCSFPEYPTSRSASTVAGRGGRFCPPA